jgi:hypothetical protein
LRDQNRIRPLNLTAVVEQPLAGRGGVHIRKLGHLFTGKSGVAAAVTGRACRLVGWNSAAAALPERWRKTTQPPLHAFDLGRLPCNDLSAAEAGAGLSNTSWP